MSAHADDYGDHGALSDRLTAESADGAVVAVADLAGRLVALSVRVSGRTQTHVLGRQIVETVNAALDRSAGAAVAAIEHHAGAADVPAP